MASTNKDKLKELLGKIAISTNIITVEDDINHYTVLELLNALRSNVKEINKILDNLDGEVKEEVQRLIDNGTLDKLINEELLGEKVDKGFFNTITGLGNNYVSDLTLDEIYEMYDKLVSSATSRFTWITLGKDQSETYDIRLYRYVPTDYNTTIFVTCAIHGWENYSTYIMYLLFKKLLDDSDLTPSLYDLRKTRIICIPVANPWGLMADDHTGVNPVRRGNSRGVDLNRNFDWRWAQNGGNFGLSKGDAPFSEAETKIIKKVFDEYNISFYIDLHNFYNSDSEARDYLFYSNTEYKYNTYQFTNWLEKEHPGSNIEITLSENDSSANNWAHRVRDIASINIECIKNRFGEDDDSRWLECIMGFLGLAASSFHNLSYGRENGSKFNQRQAKNTFNYTVPTSWTNVTDLSASYDVNCNGMMIVSGFLTVEISSGDSTSTFTYSPYISQEDFYTAKSTGSRSKPYVRLSSGIITVPINVMMVIKKGYGQATFGIDVIAEGTGTWTIKRADLTYVTIPCDNTYINAEQHNIVK